MCSPSLSLWKKYSFNSTMPLFDPPFFVMSIRMSASIFADSLYLSTALITYIHIHLNIDNYFNSIVFGFINVPALKSSAKCPISKMSINLVLMLTPLTNQLPCKLPIIAQSNICNDQHLHFCGYLI